MWLAGALASQLGDGALYFALGWAASEISATAAGLVLTGITLPRTVLLLLGGAVGDRFGARRVMIAGDAVMLAVAVLLGLLVVRLGTSLALLLSVALVVGVVDAFYLPSAGSMPRRLVADAQLTRALALRQSGSQLVSMAGGPLGGALVAVAGLAAVAWVDAATFLVVLIVLVLIRARPDSVSPVRSSSVLGDAVDGVRVAAGTPALRSTLLLVAGVAGFVIPGSSLLVPLLARDHGWSATAAGVVVGAQSAGTLLASLVVARIGGARRPGRAAAAASLLIATGQCAVALTVTSWSAAVGATAVGLGVGVFVGNLAPVLMGVAPRTHLARVQALLGLVQSGALLISTNVLAGLAHAASPVTATLVCATVVLGCAAVAALTPTLRGLRSAPRPA